MDKVVRIKMKLKPLIIVLMIIASFVAIIGITLAVIALSDSDWLNSPNFWERFFNIAFCTSVLVEAIMTLLLPRYKINDSKFSCVVGFIRLFSVDSDKLTALRFYKTGEVVIYTDAEHYVLSITINDYETLKTSVKKFCKNALISVDEE